MESDTELAKNIQSAMKAKHLSQEQLGEMLATNRVMVEKLLSGNIVPSIHLQKQLVEVLGIPRERIVRLTEQRSGGCKTHKQNSRGGLVQVPPSAAASLAAVVFEP